MTNQSLASTSVESDMKTPRARATRGTKQEDPALMNGFAALSFGAHARAAQTGGATRAPDMTSMMREMLDEQAKLGEKMDAMFQQLGEVTQELHHSRGAPTVSRPPYAGAAGNKAKHPGLQRGMTGNPISSNSVHPVGRPGQETPEQTTPFSKTTSSLPRSGPAFGVPKRNRALSVTDVSQTFTGPLPGQQPQRENSAGSQELPLAPESPSSPQFLTPRFEEDEQPRSSVKSNHSQSFNVVDVAAVLERYSQVEDSSPRVTDLEGGDAVAPNDRDRTVRVSVLEDPVEEASEEEEEDSDEDAAPAAQPLQNSSMMAKRSTVQGEIEAEETVVEGWLLLPSSPLRMAIDFVALLLVMSDVVLVPITVCFRGEDVQFLDAPEAVLLSTIFFTFEIIMNCCTIFYSGDKPVVEHSLILREYVRSRRFILDVVATVPWDAVLFAKKTTASIRNARAMRLIRLVRVVKLRRILTQVSHVLEQFLPPITVVVLNKLAKICLFLPCYFHVVACLWGLIGDPDGWLGWDPPGGYPGALAERRDPDRPFEYTSGDIGEIVWLTHCSQGGPCEPGILGYGSPWLIRYGLYGQIEGLALYSYCLQWATAIFTTIGLDVVPGNMRERIFFYVANVGSFLAASVLIANVVSIIQRLNMEREEFDHRSRMVRMFLKKHKLSLQLQERIRRYLTISFDRAREVEAGECATTYLSEELQKDILLEVRIGFILRHPFFKELQREAIRYICFRIRHVFRMSGDSIFVQGQMANSMIFLMSGTFGIVVQNDNGTTETPMPAPCWIGDFCLFTPNDGPCVRAATVRAQTDIEYLEVERDVLYEVVNDFPAVHDHFVNFVNQISRGEFVSTGIQCSICGGFGHSPVDCDGRKGAAEKGPVLALALREQVKRKLRYWCPCLAHILPSPSRATQDRDRTSVRPPDHGT